MRATYMVLGHDGLLFDLWQLDKIHPKGLVIAQKPGR